jgi:hypothetical protein
MTKSFTTFRHAEVRYQNPVGIQEPFVVPPQYLARGIQDTIGMTIAMAQ